VSDVAASADGSLWAITTGVPGNQLLYRVEGGTATQVANLFQFEAKRNPHMTAIDSNAFDVADLDGQEALVADAAGNDLLTVNKHGKVKLVAVLPDEPVSTENLKNLAGCPTPPTEFAFVCGLPPMLPAEPVATSVAIGPDGAYYVGELKGFPAPTGASKVWRIDPRARNAKCGQSPQCSVALEGFTSIIDLAFGPDGRLYVTQIDDASWAAVEFGLGGLGGSVHACNLATQACETVVSGQPMLTSITFRNDGSLWEPSTPLSGRGGRSPTGSVGAGETASDLIGERILGLTPARLRAGCEERCALPLPHQALGPRHAFLVEGCAASGAGSAWTSSKATWAGLKSSAAPCSAARAKS
jgi:hypothetical protein